MRLFAGIFAIGLAVVLMGCSNEQEGKDKAKMADAAKAATDKLKADAEKAKGEAEKATKEAADKVKTDAEKLKSDVDKMVLPDESKKK
jgi:outer membrane PBP1 activator LpoA protein